VTVPLAPYSAASDSASAIVSTRTAPAPADPGGSTAELVYVSPPTVYS